MEKRDIYNLVRKQISLFFFIPCILAIIGAGIGIYVFMLRFGHKVESYIGTEDFMLNIILAMIILITIFIAYFVGTIKAYKHSIESGLRRNFRKRI